MNFLSVFVSTGIQYILMLALAVGAVLLGITMRKKKDASKKEEE